MRVVELGCTAVGESGRMRETSPTYRVPRPCPRPRDMLDTEEWLAWVGAGYCAWLSRAQTTI